MGGKKGFICESCNKFVSLTAPGTKNRNHCPYCLASVHLDLSPGDRLSKCKGIMPAIGKLYKEDGEEMLVHQCEKCQFTRKNRVAGDDSFKKVEKLPIVTEEVLKNDK